MTIKWERHFETKTCKQSKKVWRVDYITETHKNNYDGGIYLNYIAEVNGQCDNNTSKNARLIAAAPELLEALELIANYQANEKYHETDWKAQVYKAKDIARQAIAKAKGE